jgi:hypothetical protein
VESAVQRRRGATPETGVRGERGDLRPESCGVDRREKLFGEPRERPYRKPTQVGEASSLR